MSSVCNTGSRHCSIPRTIYDVGNQPRQPFRESISNYSYSVTNYSRHAYTVLQSVRGDALMSDHTMPEKSRSSGPKWNLAALFVVTEQSNGGL